MIDRKRYYQENKEKWQIYCQKNKEKIARKKKIYRQKNKVKIKKWNKEYHLKNKKKMNKYSKKYREEHKEELKKYFKKYRAGNKKRIKKQNEKERKNKPQYFKKYAKKYQKTRKQSDINFKILCNLRTRLHHALQGKNKSKNTMKLLGCTTKELKIHLEKRFKKGMTWENYGAGWYGKGMKEWHIDHIIPCCRFDLSKEEEQRKCFHYSNLRPLWAEENRKMSKKNKEIRRIVK